MQFEGRIAWRYLFSKKGHNAINIVSGVSAAAVAVVTAAMICVMSVLNGFGSLVEKMFSQFDPELKITAVEGKSFSLDDEAIVRVCDLPYISITSRQVQETALIRYKQHQMPAIVLGVDDDFQRLTNIDSIIVDGHYSVYDGAFERTVMGRGLATLLGVNAHFVGGIHLYAPKRLGRVNMLRPDQSFNEQSAFMAGTFAVNQVQYDDRYLLVSLQLAQALFDYDERTVTALALQIDDATSLRRAKQEIQSILGDRYIVADRYEQQTDFFRIVRVEKLLTTLLLVFILLIAGFNVISSLSMLILDKRESIRVLSNLGATADQIRRVFLFEGWLISSLGAAVGLALGLIVCLAQEHLGIIKLGTGTEYIIEAYPVVVQATDVLLVTVIVLSLGFVAAYYPAMRAVNENKENL